MFKQSPCYKSMSSILQDVFTLYYQYIKSNINLMSTYEQHQVNYRGSFPIYQKNSNCQKGDYQVDEGNINEEGSNQVINLNDKKLKDKNQTVKCKSSTKIPDNLFQYNANWPQLRVAESVYQDQAAVDWIKKQLTKIGERIAKNQQDIEQLSTGFRELEQKQSSSTPLPNPHFQQINKILSLVQKAQNRDDYRKTIKMIEQLRVCILQCHMQLNNLKYQHQQSKKQRKKNNVSKIQNFTDELIQLNIKIEKQSRQLSAKIQVIDNKFNQWEQDHSQNNHHFVIGEKTFNGKMITLLYEEKISNLNNNNQKRPDNATRNKFSFKQRTQAEDPQKEDITTVILTTKTYYLDNEGYLLDKMRHYLLNRKNQPIRLSNKEIELLKQQDLL